MTVLSQEQVDGLNSYIEKSIDSLVKGFVAQFPNYLDTCQYNILQSIASLEQALSKNEVPADSIDQVTTRIQDSQSTYDQIFGNHPITEQHIRMQSMLSQLIQTYLEYTTKLELESCIAELYSQFRFFFGNDKEIMPYLLASMDAIKNKVILLVAYEIPLESQQSTHRKKPHKGFALRIN